MASEAEIETNKAISASEINYVNYQSEAQMPQIMELFQKDLSEPYSVYTYRYFINNWANLCFLAYHETECVGAIVCKLDARESRDSRLQNTLETSSVNTNATDNIPVLTYKGYIAMLAVKREYRKLKIGSKLVKLAVNAMRQSGADEVVLETEVNNKPALKLYENLGFLRDKRLYRYYLNGLDAFRLKLWIDITKKVEQESIIEAMASVKVDDNNTQTTNQNNNSTIIVPNNHDNKIGEVEVASCS